MLTPPTTNRLARFDDADLGPHAAILLGELRRAATARMPVAVVVLAAALIDVVAHEQAGPAGWGDGMAFAWAGNKAALGWLRGRRNQFLHHDGPADGLMAEAGHDQWLAADADRAVITLLDYLDDLAGDEGRD